MKRCRDQQAQQAARQADMDAWTNFGKTLDQLGQPRTMIIVPRGPITCSTIGGGIITCN
jgi:hypothetical protein